MRRPSGSAAPRRGRCPVHNNGHGSGHGKALQRNLELRERLHAEIERDRVELRHAFEEMKVATREAVSLERRIQQRPAAWIAGAFVLGFFLGYRGR